MRAIEFIAISEKGTITVPKEYQNQLKGTFRVIILQDQEPTQLEQKSSKRKSLTAVQIETKGLSFTRDEANER